MTARKGAAAPPPTGPGEDGPDEFVRSGVDISSWQFIDEQPTAERVLELLDTLPHVWGINTRDFADYVQVLPQKKKVSMPHPENPRAVEDVHLMTYTLYMSVAGRLKMLEAAAALNGWHVDFIPEPNTPTGIPGFLDYGNASSGGANRIVYREYVEIRQVRGTDGMPLHVRDSSDEVPVAIMLGRKPGMAWVPYSGGNNAAGSNPYEKVETSARGRALAAWGFGVFPGSGVASAEEVLGAAQNAQAMRHGGVVPGAPPNAQGSDRGKPQEELVQDVLLQAERLRLARGMDQKTMTTLLVKYLTGNLGLKSVYNEQDDEIDWKKVKAGGLIAMRQSLAEEVRKAENEGISL